MIRKIAAILLLAFASSNAYADSAASIPYGTSGHKLCRVDQNCVFSGNVTFTGAQGPAVGDTNYTILSTDKVVYTSATLTATRTWTLPAANSVAAGYRLIVVDLFGGVSLSNNLRVTTPFGSFDTLLGNGNSGSVSIKESNGEIQFISDGTSAWVYSMIQTGGGALAVTPVSHNFLTGLSSATNVFSKAQPAFTDISGSATTAQLPNSGVTTVNGVSCTIGSTCTLTLKSGRIGGANGAQAANTTSFYPVMGSVATVTSGEAIFNAPEPIAGTYKNLYFHLNVAPGTGNTDTLTLRIAGSSSALTCTISDTATDCSDLTHSASVTLGQLTDYQMVTSTSATATRFTFGAEFDIP